MLSMTKFALITTCLALLFASASARLYGTSPVASTVWSGGQAEHVTWVDDNREPRLSKLGKMDIELYFSQTRVATLAKGIKPESKSHRVEVDPKWGPNGSDYHIRFVFSSETIYSADFTMTNMRGSSSKNKGKFLTRTSGDLDTSTISLSIPPGAVPYTPAVTFVLPDTTITSHLSPTYVTPLPTSSTKPTSTFSPSADQSSSTFIEVEARPTSYAISNNAASTTTAQGTGSKLDWERLKFRIVFILWPAMIGLTMAL